MAVGAGGSGPIGLVAPWRFKTLDSQPVKSNMGPVSNDISEKLTWLPDTVFTVFLVWSSPTRISEFFGRDRNVARRTVMQTRGGITSRSALVDLFMPI